MAAKARNGTNGKGHMLTFEDIAAADDLRELTVEIPQWGGSVRVRELTKGQFDAIAAECVQIEDRTERMIRIRLLTVAASLVEPAISAEQAEVFQAKNRLAFDRLAAALDDLNRLGGEGFDRAEAEFRPVLAR